METQLQREAIPHLTGGVHCRLLPLLNSWKATEPNMLLSRDVLSFGISNCARLCYWKWIKVWKLESCDL